MLLLVFVGFWGWRRIRAIKWISSKFLVTIVD